MTQTTDNMTKIFINALLQKLTNNIDKNIHILGLFPMIALVATTVFSQNSEQTIAQPILLNDSHTVITHILEDIEEIPPTIEQHSQVDHVILVLAKIKNILESSIHTWIKDGYTSDNIFQTFNTIKELTNSINQNSQSLMYLSG